MLFHAFSAINLCICFDILLVFLIFIYLSVFVFCLGFAMFLVFNFLLFLIYLAFFIIVILFVFGSILGFNSFFLQTYTFLSLSMCGYRSFIPGGLRSVSASNLGLPTELKILIGSKTACSKDESNNKQEYFPHNSELINLSIG